MERSSCITAKNKLVSLTVLSVSLAVVNIKTVSHN